MPETMEQGFIRFAKVHGYIIAFQLGCSAIVPFTGVQDFKDVSIPVLITAIIIFIINSFLMVRGCMREDGRWLKPVKYLFILILLGQFLILYQKITGSYNAHSVGTIIGSFAVSFYDIYVVRFLEKLFNTLKLHRAGIVSITAIVCEDPPTVPSQQPVRPGLSDGPVRPPAPSAAATTNTTAALKLKEFLTWK